MSSRELHGYMGSRGIEGLIVETHNWGKSVAFWRDLGYELEDSLVLRHPTSGPIIFLVEQPDREALQVVPIVGVEECATFTPPPAGTVERGFEAQHWGVSEMLMLDPDDRRISLQGPLPPGVEAPEGHG